MDDIGLEPMVLRTSIIDDNVKMLGISTDNRLKIRIIPNIILWTNIIQLLSERTLISDNLN